MKEKLQNIQSFKDNYGQNCLNFSIFKIKYSYQNVFKNRKYLPTGPSHAN